MRTSTPAPALAFVSLATLVAATEPRADAGVACDARPKAERKACREVHAARALAATGSRKEAADRVGRVRTALPGAAPAILVLAAEWRGDAELLQRVGMAEEEALPGLKRRALFSLVSEGERRGSPRLVDEATRALLALEDLGADDTSAAQAARARALDSLGQQAAAAKIAADALVRDPGHREVRKLEPWLDEGRVKLSEAQKNQRIDRLLNAARFRRALKELERSDRVRAPQDPVQVERGVLQVTALVRVDRHKDARALAERLATEERAPDEWHKIYAWVLGKTKREAVAADVWAALSRTTKDAELKQEACFFSGFLRYEAQQYAEARRRLQGCEETLAGGVWAPAALWYRALTFLLEDKWEDAVPLLARLVQEHATHREADKHEYWLARALLQTGADKARARKLLGKLQVARHTWYGLLAARRLGLKPARGAKVAPDAFARRAAKDEEADRARLLFALGFETEARALSRARGNETEDLALSAALGDVHRPWRWGGRYKPRRPVRGRRVVRSSGWRASYPTPWRDVMEGACATRKLDPAYAWAIMRQESGFNPRAESKVGARGAMQMMPYTARGVRKLGGHRFAGGMDLFRPEVSIPLGVTWLATTRDELGSVLLSAAAYNGGPENVGPWMNAFGHLEPELFVERIPFKETRDYVKLVLPARAVYRALEGEPLVLDIPDEPVGGAPAKVTAFRPQAE